MATERISEILLRYAVDQGSVSRVLSVNDDVTESLGRTARQALSLEDAAASMNRELAETARSRAIDNLADEARRATEETDDWNRVLRETAQTLSDIGASEDEIKRVTRALADTDTGGGRGRGRGRGDGRDRFDEIENVGERSSAIASAFEGGGELANLTGLIGDVGAAARTMNPVFAASALALGATTVALSAYNAEMDKQRERLEGALQGQEAYYDALENLTTQEVQARIGQLQNAQPILQQQIQETQGAINSAFAQLQANFGDGLARALIAGGQGPTAQLEEQLRALQSEAQANETSLVRLNQGLESGVFAANDMRRAEENLAAQRETEAQKYLSGIEEEIRQRAELNNLIVNGTREEKFARLEQLQLDQQVVQAQLQAAERQASLAATNPGIVADLFSEEDLQELRDRAAQLGADISLLAGNLFATDQAALNVDKSAVALSAALTDMSGVQGNVARTTREAAEAEKELADERKKLAADEYLEATEFLVEAQQAAIEAARELAEAEQEHAANLAKIEIEMRTAIAKAAGEREESIAEARSKAADRLLKIEEKLGEDLARIKAKYTDQIEDAEGRRDVEAAIRLKKQRDQELKDREKSAEDQRKEVDDSLKEQLRIIDQRYREQEQRAREAAQRARDQEITRANQEIALRRAANDQAQVDLINAKNAERTLTQAYYALVQSDLVNHLNAMRALQQPTSSPSQYTAPSPFGFGGSSTAIPSIGGASSVDNSRSNIYNIYVSKDGVTTEQARALGAGEAVRVVREILRAG